jgi:protein-disulfide isomerase
MEELNLKTETLLPEGGSSVPEMPEVKKHRWLDFIGNNFLGLSILVTGLLISGSILYANNEAPAAVVQGQGNNVKVDVSIDDDPMLGNKDAKVTIIEFSDYQCPFCRVFWKDSFAQLKKEYIDTGKVRFVYRDYALSFHPMADPSAQAAECADDQGKYWELHDKIFAEQEKKGQGTVQFTLQELKQWASSIGLDSAAFNACLDSGKHKDEVKKDLDAGTAAGVTGTPSFFINGRFIVGAQPYSTFKTLIEEELKKK